MRASNSFRNTMSRKVLLKRERRNMEHSVKIEESRKQLNLQLNGGNIYEGRGRIQGVYPIYLPSSSALCEKNVKKCEKIISAHRKNLYGGVTSAISEVGSLFWLAVLRKLTKSVIQNCYSCEGSEQRIIQMLNQGSYCEIELSRPYHLRLLVPNVQVRCIINLKVKRILNRIYYYFLVVLAELCI